MNSPSNDTKDTPVETTVRHNLLLPIIALVLSLLPFIANYLMSVGINISGSILSSTMAPILGLFLGFMALVDKEKIGPTGVLLARIAMGIPLAIIAFFLIFFIGAATGLISLM